MNEHGQSTQSSDRPVWRSQGNVFKIMVYTLLKKRLKGCAVWHFIFRVLCNRVFSRCHQKGILQWLGSIRTVEVFGDGLNQFH